jgi:type I restriction enzyme S subunit
MDGNHGNIHPKSEDYEDSGIPFVMASDLRDGTIDFSTCAYLQKEQADRLQKGFAHPGDVLISHKATIGVTAIVPSVDHYVMLTPQVTYYRSMQPTRLSNLYLKCFFDSEGFQRAFSTVARDGSTRSYIGITKQRSLMVAYPRIEEQREISDILNTVERKIVVAKNRQRAFLDLFRTLLHQLMTAQIRVNDLDLEEILVQPTREDVDEMSLKGRKAGQRAESSSQ